MSSNLDVRTAANGRGANSGVVPVLHVEGPWAKVLLGRGKEALQVLLPAMLRSRRWFGGKGRQIRSAEIVDRACIEYSGESYYLCMIRVEYVEGGPETYLLPLSFQAGDSGDASAERDPAGVLFRLNTETGDGVVFDAARDRQFARALLEWIGNGQTVSTDTGEIDGVPTRSFEELKGESGQGLEPHAMRAEQSNTSMRFGERLILKLYRRVDSGINPDFEIGRVLTERGFSNCAPVAGALELREPGAEPSTLAIVQGFVRNRGDAWQYTLESLRAACDRAVAQDGTLDNVEVPTEPLLQLVDERAPEFIRDIAGEYLDSAALLGRRTGEMHVKLAAGDEPDFAPEPFTPEYARWLYGSMAELTAGVMLLLRSHLGLLRDGDRRDAEMLVGRRDELLDQFRAIMELDVDARLIRVHGDYHLGQVLFTGEDFVIIDFEGEPLRPILERRKKRSALQDVAGMLRSFQYAAFSVLMERDSEAAIDYAARANAPGGSGALHRLIGNWSAWVSAAFLREYLRVCGGSSFVPQDRRVLAMLLNALQLEKAVYELGYEINNRPGWVRVPMHGITRLLDERAEETRGLREVA